MITVNNMSFLGNAYTARSFNSAQMSFKAKKQPADSANTARKTSDKPERRSAILVEFEDAVKEMKGVGTPSQINANLARYVQNNMNDLMVNINSYSDRVEAVNIVLENASPQDLGINLVCGNLPAVFKNINKKDRGTVIQNILGYVKPEYDSVEYACQELALSLKESNMAPLATDMKGAFDGIVDKASENDKKGLTESTVAILRGVIPYLLPNDQPEAERKLNKLVPYNPTFKHF